MSASLYFLAIDVARFLPLHDFDQRMQFVKQTVMGSRPAPGYDEVLIAGEPEWRTEEIRRREGIPIPVGVWNHLSEAGRSVGVTPPPARPI